MSEDREQRHAVSLGEELLDRLDPSEMHENVLPTTRGLLVAVGIVVAFLWFLFAMIEVFYAHVLDQTVPNLGLFLFTLPPILFLAAGLLFLYWFLAGIFSLWNAWGRASRGTARWFWFVALAALTYVFADPFNASYQKISSFSIVGKTDWLGLPEINVGVLSLYAVIGLLVVALFYEHVWNGISKFLAHAAHWHDQLVSILLGMKITAIHFGRAKVTEQYPEEKQELSPIFRGRHMLAWDEQGEHLCIACKACEKICPDRLIMIESVRNPETRKLVLTGFILDNSRCSFCGLCEDVCPTGAIRHSTEYAYSAYTRDELVLDVFGEYVERTGDLRGKGGTA